MFVVIEGIDGCGKSTQAKLLGDYFESQGQKVLLTAEPTSGFIGQAIRMILSGKMEADPKTLALLFTADRAEHLAKTVEPALADGKLVICERYYYSTMAYQTAQGINTQWIMDINSFAREPDLVILLDIRTEQGLKRLDREKDIFEVRDFQKKVEQFLVDFAYRGRKRYPKTEKTHWKVIDGSGEVEDIQARLRDAIEARLPSELIKPEPL